MDKANRLLLTHLSFVEELASVGGVSLTEHPDDPGGDPFPSIWATPQVKNLEATIEAKREKVMQCAHGSPSMTPILFSGTVRNLDRLEDVSCCPGESSDHVHVRAYGRNGKERFLSTALSTYLQFSLPRIS